jgi:RNA recognition motif-containing protein
MRDSEGVSKQFGFTCFANSEDAQKALDHFKSADKENKGLVVCEFKTKEQRRMELEKTSYQFKKSMQLMNLIVRNVDPECSKEEFTDFFSNFGEVRSVKLIPDHQIGFVCFMDREAARMAKENANLVLRNRRLDANFCEPKESRQKRQEELWDRRVFDKQKASQYQQNNSDVIALISSLSMLMSQLQKGGNNPRMSTGPPQQQNFQQNLGAPQGPRMAQGLRNY